MHHNETARLAALLKRARRLGLRVRLRALFADVPRIARETLHDETDEELGEAAARLGCIDAADRELDDIDRGRSMPLPAYLVGHAAEGCEGLEEYAGPPVFVEQEHASGSRRPARPRARRRPPAARSSAKAGAETPVSSPTEGAPSSPRSAELAGEAVLP